MTAERLHRAVLELRASATAYAAERARYAANHERYEDFAAVQQRLFRAAVYYETARREHAGQTYSTGVLAALRELAAVDLGEGEG